PRRWRRRASISAIRSPNSWAGSARHKYQRKTDGRDTRPPFAVAEFRYLRARRAPGSGIPMQVVVPSVSRADLLHGTALTVSVASPSSAALDMPTVVPGFCGLPTTGADPVIGTLDGAAAAGGGVATASLCCCAHADDDSRTSVAAMMILRIM